MADPEGPAAIGIDIGGTKLVAATVAADGTVLERHRRATPATDAERLVATVAELAETLAPSGSGRLPAASGSGRLPIGIGIAGLVEANGTLLYAPNLAVRDLPLAQRVAAATGAPVTVVNDASAAALGEQRAGAAQGHRDVALFTLGTGVGGGLLVGGELVIGAQGFAGELGHLVVAEGGRRCPCGNRGCIEAYASGRAIARIAAERLRDRSSRSVLRDERELDGRSVTDAALAGDELAREVLVEVGAWLGVAAGNVVNALDPQLVLVGGGAAARTARFVPPAARSALADRVLGGRERSAPPVGLAALGDDAGMIGAALLASERDHARVPVAVETAHPDAEHANGATTTRDQT